jgi:hypothetical protein
MGGLVGVKGWGLDLGHWCFLEELCNGGVSYLVHFPLVKNICGFFVTLVSKVGLVFLARSRNTRMGGLKEEYN